MLGALNSVTTDWLVLTIFIGCVLGFLALDLGVFHRDSKEVKFKEAMTWTIIWIVLALSFGVGLIPWKGKQDAMEFITGYVLELSLSMDNVFVIALVFSYFRIPRRYQHRVLFWGILGALVMRAFMIAAGTALVQRFQWTLYIFGAFLVLTGIKMLFAKEDGVHPEDNPLIKLARKLFPVSNELEGEKFIVIKNGVRTLTPLALVLIMVESSDVIFALDSIPAIFAVTTKFFIVFTSNIFAILGLRSLYFVLAGAIDYFRHLKYGLSVILVIIGIKMLIADWFHVSPAVALGLIAAIILISIFTSILEVRRKGRHS